MDFSPEVTAVVEKKRDPGYVEWSLFVVNVIVDVTGSVFDFLNFCELLENAETTEGTDIEKCDIAVNTYVWVFLGFVIFKLVCNLISDGTDCAALCNRKFYKGCIMGFSVMVAMAENANLIVLLIFSYQCLRPEGSNVFHDMTSDLLNDFLGGAFGTFGMFIKLNRIWIAPLLKGCCKSCCKCDSNSSSGCTKVLTVFFILLSLGCLIESIVLLVVYENEK